MSSNKIDWSWLFATTGLTPPAEEEQPVLRSQEADGGAPLSFSQASDPIDHHMLWDWQVPLEPVPDPFAFDEDIFGDLDLFDHPPEQALSAYEAWPDQPNPAPGRERDGNIPKRTADEAGNSEWEASAFKRARLDLDPPPWFPVPAIVDQTVITQFGEVHIQAPTPREPMLLLDEEWLDEEHIDAGMGHLAARLRRQNPAMANRTRFISVQASHQLRLLGGEYEEDGSLLRSRLLNEAGTEAPQYLFLPMSNASDSAGTHWSLLFLDFSDVANPRGYHYDSISRSNNFDIAASLATGLGVSGGNYFEGAMAQQNNGYDCGIAILAATREMIIRLSQGTPCDNTTLDLSLVDINRSIFQDWLQRPETAHEEAEANRDMSDADQAERDLDVDLFGTPVPSRSPTPWLALPGSQSVQMPLANTFSQAQADAPSEPSARPATRQRRNRRVREPERALPDRIIGAVTAALDAMQPESQQIKIHIAKMREEFLNQLPNGLLQHPFDIRAAVDATLEALPRRPLHDEAYEKITTALIPLLPSVAVQTEMDNLGLTDGKDRKPDGGVKHAKALKESHPTLSIATAAWLSGVRESSLRQEPVFQNQASKKVQTEMKNLVLTDENHRNPDGGMKHAKTLKESHPTLSIATAAWLSGARESDLRQEPVFQEQASLEVKTEMDNLGLTDRNDRKPGGGVKHAKALKKSHPTLSIATAAWLSGARETSLRQEPVFQNQVSKKVQAEMDNLGLTNGNDRKPDGGMKHAKTLKKSHPTLNIATAAWLSGTKESDLRQEPVFQNQASKKVETEMDNLGLTDRNDRKPDGGVKHAKALKKSHPTLSIATAAWLSGVRESDLRKEPVFQDQASLEVKTEMDNLGLTDGNDRNPDGGMKHAKALKKSKPTLSIATASWLSGTTQGKLRAEPMFQNQASKKVKTEMGNLGLTDENDRNPDGGMKHAKALKESHPTLSIATAAWLSGVTESNLGQMSLFQDQASTEVQTEMENLGLTDGYDRKPNGGMEHAKALKKSHPTLSIATAAWLSGVTESNLRQEPVFQDQASTEVQTEMDNLGLTDENHRKPDGGMKHAKALKKSHPTLSIATAAWLSGVRESDLRKEPVFQDQASLEVKTEMDNLGLTDENDRKPDGGMKHAKALKESHPTLSIATASWLSGTTQGKLRKTREFREKK